MKLNFTSRYMDMDFGGRNKLTEYFQLVPEHWGKCEPVSWWGAQKVQFPNLSGLACDFLTIPGFCLSFCNLLLHSQLTCSLDSAVAVERIFSGGRDTISPRRASMKSDTIRTLMLVKQRLKLNRYKDTSINEVIV